MKRTQGRSVLMIYTGGTIGSELNRSSGSLRPVQFERVMEFIPEVAQLEIDVDVHSFAEPVDSSDMNPLIWKDLAGLIRSNYHRYDGFVILHGTDTMSYSASALSFMIENCGKPVIFTGSQLPVNQIRSDARENLITALEIAGGNTGVREVCIYFEYKLFRGNRSIKMSSEHFDAFVSPNYPILGEAGVHLKIYDDYLLKPEEKEVLFKDQLEDSVFALRIFPGISLKRIEYILNDPELKGLILQTYGSGNCPTDPAFTRIIREAVDRGMFIGNVSQCPGGNVIPSLYEAGIHLEKAGVCGLGDMTTEAAVTKLMWLSGYRTEESELRALMPLNLRGEIST